MIFFNKSPLRISYLGGGTDNPEYFKKFGCSIISAAIEKYCYVSFKEHSEIFDEKIRLNYFNTEIVNSNREINNSIIKNSLIFHNINKSIYIGTISDIPSGSGLGSSSAFNVSLNKILLKYLNKKIDYNQLCRLCFKIEKNRALQDIAISAKAIGLNTFRINSKGSIKSKQVDSAISKKIEDASLLIWTNTKRKNHKNWIKQNKEIDNKINLYHKIKDLTDEGIKILNSKNFKLSDFIFLIQKYWALKNQTIHYPAELQKIFDFLHQYSKVGYKLCGSGDGGFVLVMGNQKDILDIRSNFENTYKIKFNKKLNNVVNY